MAESRVVMTRRARILLVIVLAAPLAYVAQQAIATLQALTVVERERDTWQRPDDVLEPLALAPGRTVVDLGSGAGYFALKIAPRVAPGGRVLAVDLRRQSLAFLWMRATLQGRWNLDVIHGEPGDPRLPQGVVVRRADCQHLSRADRPGTDPESAGQRDAAGGQAGRRRSRSWR